MSHRMESWFPVALLERSCAMCLVCCVLPSRLSTLAIPMIRSRCIIYGDRCPRCVGGVCVCVCACVTVCVCCVSCEVCVSVWIVRVA